MTNRDKLIRCFTSVFDEVEEETIPALNSDVKEWDSLRLVMLISIVQQEFSVEVGVEEIDSLSSFDAFLRKIEGQSELSEKNLV